MSPKIPEKYLEIVAMQMLGKTTQTLLKCSLTFQQIKIHKILLANAHIF